MDINIRKQEGMDRNVIAYEVSFMKTQAEKYQ